MEISQIQVSVVDVTKLLTGLDTSKACGPDASQRAYWKNVANKYTDCKYGDDSYKAVAKG